jgi:CheY-like chemotaxis protein
MIIDEVIDRAMSSTAALFETKGLQAVRDIEVGLPRTIGDKDRLIQVVINLISNAVKFQDRGEITCRVRRTGNDLTVSVIDSGIGIHEAELAKVFEKFKQVGDTLTDKPQGTGLGLPISKEIVEHHEGRIWVESTVGKGTTFSFTLPIKAIGSEAVEPETPVLPTIAPAPTNLIDADVVNVGNRSILVVDDDINLRQLLRQELEPQGYLIREARDGEDAIAQVKLSKPDLIVLDIMMPKMNGFDMAQVLKNDPETVNIPIVILSVIEERARAASLNVDAYLTKPLDVEILQREIESLLSKKAAEPIVTIETEQTPTKI